MSLHLNATRASLRDNFPLINYFTKQKKLFLLLLLSGFFFFHYFVNHQMDFDESTKFTEHSMCLMCHIYS